MRFLNSELLAPPLLPADLGAQSANCAIRSQPASERYKTHSAVKYDQSGWEHRIAADWRYFDAPASEGWLTVIDFRKVGDQLAYRYLANDNSHNSLYEPWSSSKIFAFTAAVATLRQHGIGADASVGGITLRDMATSINSYAKAGNANGNSNAIATYLLNIAGRDFATSLFHDAWLKLGNTQVRFRGAYGPTALDPGTNEFVSRDGDKRYTPPVFVDAGKDPGYLPYRCTQCGTDGNKAMTALAQTEWLKRLASHDREPATRHPQLTRADVETLLYGGSELPPGSTGGMLTGISVLLPNALAQALQPQTTQAAATTLDGLTHGRWRVYQKVGWGPSETRGTSELVMLAHVCLPNVGGTGREFTLLARTSVPGDEIDESGVGRAGLKMRDLLNRSLPALLDNSSAHQQEEAQ
ncbi:MAG: hypothetical protein AAFO81_04905 [Pseudomonadota bacterium]